MKVLYIEDELYNEFFETLVEKFSTKELEKDKLLDFGFEYDDYRSVQNLEFIEQLLARELVSFDDVIDRFKAHDSLKTLIHDDIFMPLLDNNKITDADLESVIKQITIEKELERFLDFSSCGKLLEYALSRFLIDKEQADRLSNILEDKQQIFEIVQNRAKDEYPQLEEAAKISLFAYNAKLDKDQSLKLAQELQKNLEARERLLRLIQAHLEVNFSNFDELMSHLCTRSKKNLLNI